MPRRLPWLVGEQSASASASASTPPRPRSSAKITPSRAKPVRQPRKDNEDSNITTERTPRKRNARGEARTPSTSPPPEVPKEEYMIEGRDADDMWRMVEDEMTSIAHIFTQHLHHQEYVRQKQVAKSKNSRTINTISRPVTGTMPDHTRRKVESVARAQAHDDAVKSILGKQARQDSDAESEESEAPAWIGTSLHGLMEQPKRSSQSLSQAISIFAPTRAAAGLKRPRKTASQYLGSSPPELPRPHSQLQKAPQSIMLAADATATESDDDDDDDDLDTPISKPMLHSTTKAKGYIERKDVPTLSTTQGAQSIVAKIPKIEGTSSIDFAPEQPVKAVSSRLERIRKRIEDAKQHKMKEENELNLHEIPTFL